ncbi:hypothetical protein CSB09_03325 [Candidatus Gracilibacteria bacterium]|nr:MAG: hypothetical protein CSB09_03325 [Candidatus Gracilibacteria bacterium]
MNIIHPIFFSISGYIEIFGVLILIYGSIKTLYKYVFIEFESFSKKNLTEKMQDIRYEIGIYILFALDFLIIADIIMTISDPTQEEMVKLGVMIVIRTMIGFFLSKEVESIRQFEKMKKEK